MRIHILAITVLLSAPGSAISAADVENHHTHERMKNACSKTELRRLQTIVSALAARQAPKQAWRLVKEMLCGTSLASTQYIRANAYDEILFDDDSQSQSADGLPVYSKKSAKELTTLAEQAWSVEVANMHKGMNVTYGVEGICIGFFTIDFKANRWQISQQGYACD